MHICQDCGSRNIAERATGVTTRAVLQAALDLSNGKKLVLIKDPDNRLMWHHPCQSFMRRVMQTVGEAGFIAQSSAHHIRTEGGGELRYFEGAESSGMKGLRPNITEWERITQI